MGKGPPLSSQYFSYLTLFFALRSLVPDYETQGPAENQDSANLPLSLQIKSSKTNIFQFFFIMAPEKMLEAIT